MLGAEISALLLFVAIIATLMLGYPVAFTLGGVSLLFAVAAQAFGVFDPSYLEATSVVTWAETRRGVARRALRAAAVGAQR